MYLGTKPKSALSRRIEKELICLTKKAGNKKGLMYKKRRKEKRLLRENDFFPIGRRVVITRNSPFIVVFLKFQEL